MVWKPVDFDPRTQDSADLPPDFDPRVDDAKEDTSIGGEFVKGAKAGWLGANKAVGSVVEYAGNLAGSETVEGIGRTASDYWGGLAKPEEGAVQNMTDIGGAEDFAKWAAWNIGQMGSQVAVTAPFMAAGTVGKAVPTGIEAIKALVTRSPGAAGKFGQFLGQWAKLKPMDIPIGILEAGQIAEGQLDDLKAGKTKELSPIRGLAAAFVATKLEELGAENALNRLMHGVGGQKGKLLRRIGKGALNTGIGEGTEEFFQSYAEKVGIDPTDTFSYKQFINAVNGAGAGFIGGFALGGGGGAISRQNYDQAAPDQTTPDTQAGTPGTSPAEAPPLGQKPDVPAPPELTGKLSPEFFRDIKTAMDKGVDNDGQPFTKDDARGILEAYKAQKDADPVSVRVFEMTLGPAEERSVSGGTGEPITRPAPAQVDTETDVPESVGLPPPSPPAAPAATDTPTPGATAAPSPEQSLSGFRTFLESGPDMESISIMKGDVLTAHPQLADDLNKAIIEHEAAKPLASPIEQPDAAAEAEKNEYVSKNRAFTPVIKIVGGPRDGEILSDNKAQIHADIPGIEEAAEKAVSLDLGFLDKDGNYVTKADVNTDASAIRKDVLSGRNTPAPGTKTFIENKIRQLGSIEAVNKFYSAKDMVSTYARDVAGKILGEGKAEGRTDAQRRDYIVDQYENGGKTFDEIAEALGIPVADVTRQYNAWVEDDVADRDAPEQIAPEPVEAEEAKAPWQMTPSEYAGKTTGDERQIRLSAHPQHVKQALADGKDVPVAVLKKYDKNQWAKNAIRKMERPITPKKAPPRKPARQSRTKSTMAQVVAEIKKNGRLQLGAKQTATRAKYGFLADYSKDDAKVLNKMYPTLLSSKGTQNLDEIAESFGYNSGDDLFQALMYPDSPVERKGTEPDEKEIDRLYEQHAKDLQEEADENERVRAELAALEAKDPEINAESIEASSEEIGTDILGSDEAQGLSYDEEAALSEVESFLDDVKKAAPAEIPESQVEFSIPGDDRSRIATITRSTKQPGKWQITWYDASGPWSDTTTDTREQALKEIRIDGYLPAEKGTLNELAKTERFQKGSEKTYIVQYINELGDKGVDDAHPRIIKAYESGGLDEATKVYRELLASIEKPTPQSFKGKNETTDLISAADTFNLVNPETEFGKVESKKDMTPTAGMFGEKAEAEPAHNTEDAGVITDFGEKIGGAKKDRSESFKKEITDDDISNLPLSKIWPKSENDAIEDTFVAAFAHSARESIPTKPQLKYKKARWVETVKGFRKMMADLFADIEAGTYSRERVLNKGKEFGILKDFFSKVRLLEQIDRDQWSRIDKVAEYPDAYRYEKKADGTSEQIPAPHVSVHIDGRYKSFEANTVEEALPRIKEALDNIDPTTASAIKSFEVRGREGAYFINKKGDGQYHKLKEFTSAKEALAYVKDHPDELQKAWDAVKELENVTARDVRSEENRPRTGNDYRSGKDVTAKQFSETFGFRGVEFGNWVDQGKNAKERQGMLNEAYDALMDLADIVGIPPKAISLDGSLALGFGSRGSGWASAHYEPDRVVINLTKTRGAGSLAHEWFHGLDNYFQKKRGGNGVRGREGDYITYNPEPYYQEKGGTRLSETRFNELVKRGNVRNPESWTKIDGVRPEVSEAFKKLTDVLDKSPMTERSRQIKADYWSRIIERAARSFENYVIVKMNDKGYQNDYLANVVRIADFKRMEGRYPYLLDEEIAPVAEAFDGLFDTIKTRPTDRGVQMYMPSSPETAGTRTPQQQAIISAKDDLQSNEPRKGYVPEQIAAAYEKATGQPFPYRFLLSAIEKLGTTVSFNVRHIENPGRSAAVYDPKRNQIIFNDGTLERAKDAVAKFEEVVSHEAIHAIVLNLRAVNMPAYIELKRNIRRFSKELVPHLDKADFMTGYVFEQIDRENLTDEILNLALTNPGFARWLDSIPATEGVKDSPTLWGKLKEIILKAIGSVTGATKTKLDELNQIMDSVMKIGETGERGDVSGLDQAEMVAYHGSPHTFDRFDRNKIGTGEGAQAYGYGLYFAGKKEVAEYYKKNLADRLPTNFTTLTPEENLAIPEWLKEGIVRSKDSLRHAMDGRRDFEDRLDQAKSMVRSSVQPHLYEKQVSDHVDTLRAINKLIDAKDFSFDKKPGRLYEVDLAPQEDEYLLWDKPLIEQSEKVKTALKELNRAQKEYFVQKYDNTTEGGLPSGKSLYNRLVSGEGGNGGYGPGEQGASMYLHSLGIRGIKYLDGTSRGAGEGNYNYVVFSDQDITIKEMYSVSAKEAGWSFSDVQSIFKGQEVVQTSPEGPIYIKTRGGQYLTIESVTHISPDEVNFQVAYGRRIDKGKETITGSAGGGVIRLVRGKAGKWTLAHESYHILREAGIISDADAAIISGHVKRLVREGRHETANKEAIGGDEDQANWFADSWNKEPPKSLAGRVVLRVRDFLDKLVNAFGKRTAGQVARDIRSGKIYEQGGEATGRTAEQYSAESILDNKEGYKKAKPSTDPPTDPAKVRDWIQNEADIFLQELVYQTKPDVHRMGFLKKFLTSPEWYEHPVFARIVRLFVRDRNEIFTQLYGTLNNLEQPLMEENTVGELARKLKHKGLNWKQKMSGQSSKEYQDVLKIIDEADIDNVEYDESNLKKQGYSADTITVWKAFRESYDRALDLMTAQMRTMIEQIEEEAAFTGTNPADFSDMYLTLKGALAQMGQLKGTYAPRTRQGNWAVRAERENDLGETEYYREHRFSHMAAERLSRKLEAEGWEITGVGEVQKLPEDVYQDLKTVSVARAIEAAIDKMTKGQKGDAAQTQAVRFNEEILKQVADMIRARGFRSSMISRKPGSNVVKGYVEDPIERHALYINNVARGTAKAKVAGRAMEELAGKMIKGRRFGGIDPKSEPEVYTTARDYMEEQLRNLDKTDRVIGWAKSLATLKFLGFSGRAAVVNMTSMGTSAPAAIHGLLGGNVSFTKIAREMGRAAKDVIPFLVTGKEFTDKDERQFMEDIKKKGWDDPQYTRDMEGMAKSVQNQAWAGFMNISMKMFEATEKFNRMATMLAAYRLARKSGMSYDDASELGKTSSDKAHGIYGRATLPAMAWGRNPGAKMAQMFYVYLKYPHSYLQLLHDLGFRKHDYKAFAYALISPMIIGGLAAWPFKEQWMWLFGMLATLLGLKEPQEDLEKKIWDITRKELGPDAEIAGRYGILGALGVDVSGSLSIGAGLPRDRYEMFGALGGAAKEVMSAGDDLIKGSPWRAAEHILPSGFANVSRAVREAGEGVTTGRKNPVFDENGRPLKPTAAETALRVGGFRSSRQAALQSRMHESKQQAQAFEERKKSIREQYRAYLAQPESRRDKDDYREILKSVREVNESIRNARLKGQVAEISMQSMGEQIRKMRMATKKEKAFMR